MYYIIGGAVRYIETRLLMVNSMVVPKGPCTS